jgi:hypothetical protein
MRTKIMVALISCLIAVGLAGASDVFNSSQNQWITKGYITIGRSVVVIPERLQTGDRIDFYNARGVKVFHQYVGSGYLAASVAKLPKGFYNVVVVRNSRIIGSQKIPLVGNTGF